MAVQVLQRPVSGPYSGTFRWLGYAPSRKNPNICARCIERAPEGGAIVPMSVFFADVRGYTTMAEKLSSVEATALLQRFYEAASKALLSQEAVLGQMAGDEVMAFFVPGLAGDGYRRRAVAGARALLEAIGYGSPEGAWLTVGAGICSGDQFLGNVGGGGFKDFTALGDVTNTAARLQGRAEGGEIGLCQSTYEAVADTYPDAERRSVELKGKQAPLQTFWIRVASAREP